VSTQKPIDNYGGGLFGETNAHRNAELQRRQREDAERPEAISERQRYQDDHAIAGESAKLNARIGRIDQTLKNAAADSPQGKAKAAEILASAFGRLMPMTSPEMPIFQKRQALDTIRTLVETAEERLSTWVGEIGVLVREHNRQRAEASERALDAKSQELARSLSDAELIDLLESPRYRARLQLNKKGEIEVAPPHYAADRQVRALIRMHAEGLKELLENRQKYAVVDVG
jgi:hypothetical protein